MLLDEQDAPEWDRAYADHCESMQRGSTALLNAILARPPEKKATTLARLMLTPQVTQRKTLWPRWYRPPNTVAKFGNRILLDVADDFGLTLGELTGDGRRGNLIDARSVIVRILIEQGWSSPRIAKQIGRNDHSTVLNLRDNFPIYAERNARVAWSYERQSVRHGSPAI